MNFLSYFLKSNFKFKYEKKIVFTFERRESRTIVKSGVLQFDFSSTFLRNVNLPDFNESPWPFDP